MIPNHIFSVKIASTENVIALKKAIKEEIENTLGHLPADALILCKVSIPADEPSKLELVNGRQIWPLEILSDVFPGIPEQAHLHIVVKQPVGGCK
jgi:hypothetical protein